MGFVSHFLSALQIKNNCGKAEKCPAHSDPYPAAAQRYLNLEKPGWLERASKVYVDDIHLTDELSI